MKIYSPDQWLAEIERKRNQSSYSAMYSSWVDGIVKNSACMMVPIDDHLVHRGDGVFEAIRAIHGRPYLLAEHLNRLSKSAAQIGLQPSHSLEKIQDIVLETLKVSGEQNAIIRIFLSRGPGDFSANPYSTLGTQFYVVITPFVPVPAEKYLKGVSIGRSQIPAKPDFFAQIKSCNYLQNVLMKKEAVDQKLDFMIGVNDEGNLLESSTENILHINAAGDLIHPPLNSILSGCTMMRVLQLAKQIPEIKSIIEQKTKWQELSQAQEVFMTGTTLDVLPVSLVQNQKVGQGAAGPLAGKLLELLREDQSKGHHQG